ncbi:Jag family protein [Microseira wollei]|uniref:Single-stranded nucleic acid binding R3H domain-containing protein n=1 Tax=Microseira wollei NIES-4236 TaxID=2530354 RepID=A0AAV3X1M4_9CYAN|nr:R3H domain-containing nucleic acid-binding protein [Microseira wollei]GET36632.1 single-stranded nucleic acid binding R3H domain-containing protein [Microseira wollei NIES-4236]
MTDSRMQRGQKWLEELLRLTKTPAQVQVEKHATLSLAEQEDESEPDSYWLTIDETNLTPAQIQALIGVDGSALDAIQYLANTTVNLGQTPEEQAAYTVELAGYRVRRQAELLEMAQYAAEQVRLTGREFELKSLSAAERRQVHTFLKDFTDLETYSRGKEPDRRLVVRLI